MEGSTFNYQYSLGSFRGVEYHIGVRADPSLDDVHSFAILLFFESVSGAVVEVTKVDNSPHEDGDVHVDRYYREEGAPIKDFDVEFETPFEAEDYRVENFRRFARQYGENHGMGPRVI